VDRSRLSPETIQLALTVIRQAPFQITGAQAAEHAALICRALAELEAALREEESPGSVGSATTDMESSGATWPKV